ncbi:MAG TPA: hypothetical protein VFU63_01310 [Ktedonobacterales bacterium]|nr:hypothetical protein [Ktedonobacterales bacterium]
MNTSKTLARYSATLLLAASLLLLGGAGAFGAWQLSGVISRQQRMDTAAAVCATLKSQRYDTLASMIDPTPNPPLAAGAFDQRAWLARLHTLDQQQGAVTDCTWHALELGDDSATYFYTLHRPHTPVPIGMLVVLVREPDIGWRISRRSPFTTNPV